MPAIRESSAVLNCIFSCSGISLLSRALVLWTVNWSGRFTCTLTTIDDKTSLGSNSKSHWLSTVTLPYLLVRLGAYSAVVIDHGLLREWFCIFLLHFNELRSGISATLDYVNTLLIKCQWWSEWRLENAGIVGKKYHRDERFLILHLQFQWT